MPCTSKQPCTPRTQTQKNSESSQSQCSTMGCAGGAAKTAFKKVSHCIFDLDGLLLGKILHNIKLFLK